MNARIEIPELGITVPLLTVAIISGARDGSRDRDVVSYLRSFNPDLVITGCARGADETASKWALENGRFPSRMFAPWQALGKVAGTKRNWHFIYDGYLYHAAGHLVRWAAFPGPNSVGTRRFLEQVERFKLTGTEL